VSPGRAPDGFWPAVLSPLAAVAASLAVGIVAAGIAIGLGAGDDQAGPVVIAVGSASLALSALLIVRRRPPHVRRLAWGTKGRLAAAIGVGVVAGIGCLVAATAVLVVGAALDPGTEDALERAQNDLEDASSGATWGLALIVLSVVVLAPLGEELLFRGILLRGLVRRLAFWPAALVSGVAFALVHLDQYVPYPLWPRTVGLVLIGVILAMVYRARGYWAAVAAHATVNGVAAVSLLVA